MPGVLPTLGNDGLLPAMWSGVSQQVNRTAMVAAGAASNPQRFTLDSNQNVTSITGALDQVVTIGAGGSYQGGVYVGQQGVLVGTGLTGWGFATPSGFADTTITTTKGSTAATVASGSGFVNGYQIGAIDSNGNNLITPGTTYTISGTSVTLSADALESFTGGYCCSVLWSQTGGSVSP